MEEAKISKIKFIVTVVVAAVFILFSTIALIIISTMTSPLILLLLLFAALTAAGVVLNEWLRYISIKLCITDKTIKGRTGFFNTVDLDSPIHMISGVKVEQSILGKVYNFGTIIITTASTTFQFELVESPYEFKDKILNKINEFIEN